MAKSSIKVMISIIFICALVVPTIESADVNRLPGYGCTAAGQKKCMTCLTIGTCVESGATFYLEEDEACVVPLPFCDELTTPGTPICSAPATVPSCQCTTAVGTCIADPYVDPTFPGAFIDCDAPDVNYDIGTYTTCEPYQTAAILGGASPCNNVCVDVACPSLINGGLCPGTYVPYYDDGCNGHYRCDTGVFQETHCPNAGYCYDTNTCACVAGTVCPTCGFIEDPTDPSGYFDCGVEPNAPGTCGTTAVFDPVTCKCVSSPADQAACTGTCSYSENTGTASDCTDYFACSGSTPGTIVQRCATGSCFVQSECNCVIV